MMAGGLAWPSGPCAPGTGSPARGYHRTLCIYCCYFFGGLIHAYSCSIMLPEGVETVLMPMAPMSDRHIGVRSCLTEVAKSGTHMHRFTALEAEARTEVFQAPAVISGDPWRTLGGPLGSVKMEKTWGKYFLKPPRMGVCVPRYPALLSGPRIVRAEGSEVKGGGRGGWIYPPPWLWYVLREAWDPRMFLFDSFLFLVGPPSEQKKGGAAFLFPFSVHMDAVPHAGDEKDVFSGGWKSFSWCPGKNFPKPNVEINATLPRHSASQGRSGTHHRITALTVSPHRGINCITASVRPRDAI